MKVSPSLYSSKNSVLDTVKLVRTTFSEYMHIDFYEKDIEEIKKDISVIRKNSDLKIDMHLICNNPTLFTAELKAIKPEYVAIQFESLEDDQMFISMLNELPNVGLALTQKTKFSDVDILIKQADYVLLMTTTPGVSGFKFSKESLNWIKRFKVKYPRKRVHVDGGVNDKVALELKAAGVDCVVSGSYLMNSTSMIASVLAMKGFRKNIKACELMIDLCYLPVVEYKANLKNILIAINEGQRGFVIVEDEKDWGIVTDGDIRRFMIETSSDKIFEQKCANKIINSKPFSVKWDDNFETILKQMFELKIEKKLKFVVVTKYNRPVGILPIETITKG